MGVDFLVCKRCGDTFPDCGSYITCNECYTYWCSDECAEEDGFRVEVEETEPDDENDYGMEATHSCSYCRGESATDHTLLSFLLTKLNTTREEVLEEWKASLKAK